MFITMNSVANIYMVFSLLSVFFILKPKPTSGQLEGENDLGNEIPRGSFGSCKTNGMCCPGRDSSCVVQQAKPNAIIEDLDDIPCYCDHACLNIGDCCPDFKVACGVFDCILSNWGLWSECDTECGSGAMTRTRSIIQEPRNGGSPCSSLIQKRGCLGTNCQKSIQSFIEETAIILPASYSLKRRASERSDITRNLRLRYLKHSDRDKAKPYCVQFEVIRSTKACRAMESFFNLREGNRVCALCETDAQRPYAGFRCVGSGGGNGFPTRFSSLREPSCHGKWKRVHSNSTCTCVQGADFIFV